MASPHPGWGPCRWGGCMPSTNERIANAAWREIQQPELLRNIEHGWCLAGVRLLVESALGWGSHELYARHGTHRTTQSPTDRSSWTWWAADLERSLKVQGLAVPAEEREPGDLVFNYAAAKPYGHVGLLLSRNLVLEVVDPRFRPESFGRGNVCITPYGYWAPTLIARLP